MFNRSYFRYRTISVSLLLLLGLLSVSRAYAQTSAFTYQGRLTDSGNPADGLYDMQFKLFDTATVGTGSQQGATITNSTVQVTNGIFVVQLDFGAAVFTGAARFLEISLRPAGSPDPRTVLEPRQPISSSPYALRSAAAATADTATIATTATNATQLGGIAASGFIQNSASQQAGTNFNISGSGTVGGTLAASVVNATTEYRINGNRVLGVVDTNNLSAGLGAGTGITTGDNNSFFGAGAGQATQASSNNAFFGAQAGLVNTAGDNSFFGASAGDSNTTGTNNAFFGRNAGQTNVSGSGNAFFGFASGAANTASNNSFFGANAGDSNTSGTLNAFFGINAGQANLTGSNNAFFGAQAGFSNTGSNNAFFGMDAGRSNTANDNSFFGAGAGDANGTGTGNSFFGFNAGGANLNGNQNSFFGFQAGLNNQTGSSNSFFGHNAGESTTTGASNAFFGRNAGQANQIGNSNAFFGASAGAANTASANSFFGANAGNSNTTGDGNAFFGANAGQSTQTGSDNAFFGRSAGSLNTASDNSFFGANAGDSNTSGTFNAFFGRNAGQTNVTGSANSFFGYHAGLLTTASDNTFFGFNAGATNQTGNNNTIIGANADVGSSNLNFATAIGAGAVASINNSVVLGRAADTVRIPGSLVVSTLGAATATHVCINAGQLSNCSSSLRYKDQIALFSPGLELINRLRPVTFNWKASGERDLGFVAEEVAAVEPLLATYNERGQVEGVKYDRITAALVNAVRQQQEQIARKDELIELLERQNRAFESRLKAIEQKLTVNKMARRRPAQSAKRVL